MIKVAFCDDNPDVINRIDTMMSAMEWDIAMDWDLFGSGKELLSHLEQTGEVYNIYVLDIELPGMDGIQVAKNIREQDQTAVLIFLTDYKEYVYQVFEVLPFRFLEKPAESGKLKKALQAAVEHIQTVKSLFFFQVGHEQLQWPIGDIKYFESAGRRMTLFGTKEQRTFYGKCDAVFEQLDPRVFTRPHASFLVNMEYIRSVKQDQLIVADRIAIPISKRCRARFKQDHMRFVERRNGIL